MQLTVTKSPSEAAALSNRLIISVQDAAALLGSSQKTTGHAIIQTSTHQLVHMTVQTDPMVSAGTAAFSSSQRSWLQLALNDPIRADPFEPNPNQTLQKVLFLVSFLRKNTATHTPFDTDRLVQSLQRSFHNVILSMKQPFLLEFAGENLVLTPSKFTFATEDTNNIQDPSWGMLTAATDFSFSAHEDSLIQLTGSHHQQENAILQPDFRFEDMGIGGLDDEFWTIFRRAFVSRIYPPELVAKLGIRHVKGLILHGPPGTGKTLMARQIAKMLHAREPKIINGPEILNKYVGKSEENIRALFKDAEDEYRAKGAYSQLHIIIFDELDAICKQRGARQDGTGVGDSIVNQLLAKLDGVEELHNVLVIGMTNRLDMLDEALLRPGRFEVKLEIPLPDLKGRVQILQIHTKAMRENAMLTKTIKDVYSEDQAQAIIQTIAEQTNNFTGAELVGLINSATSFALNRHVQVDDQQQQERSKATASNGGVAIKRDVSEMKVTMADFERALEECSAAYGLDLDEFASYGYRSASIPFSKDMQTTLSEAQLAMEQLCQGFEAGAPSALSCLLLSGPPGSGKSALAAKLAIDSNFPFVKLLSTHALLSAGGAFEASKQAHIAKLFADAYKSPLSLIVIDDLEDIIEYVDIGPRFSGGLLQALRSYLKRIPPPPNHRLFVVATTRNYDLMDRLGLAVLFRTHLVMPTVTSFQDLQNIISKHVISDMLDAMQLDQLMREASALPFSIPIRSLLEILDVSSQDLSNATARFMSAFQSYQLISH